MYIGPNTNTMWDNDEPLRVKIKFIDREAFNFWRDWLADVTYTANLETKEIYLNRWNW